MYMRSTQTPTTVLSAQLHRHTLSCQKLHNPSLEGGEGGGGYQEAPPPAATAQEIREGKK